MVRPTEDDTKATLRLRWLVKHLFLHVLVLLPVMVLSVTRIELFLVLSTIITAGSIAFALRSAGPGIGWIVKSFCCGMLIFLTLAAGGIIYAHDHRTKCKRGELECTCVPTSDRLYVGVFGQLNRIEGTSCEP